MRLNLFDWIREGVRQSVLLGVSDAAEHIGNQNEAKEFSGNILSAFDQAKLSSGGEKSGAKRKGGAKKKALGRSLSNVIDET